MLRDVGRNFWNSPEWRIWVTDEADFERETEDALERFTRERKQIRARYFRSSIIPQPDLNEVAKTVRSLTRPSGRYWVTQPVSTRRSSSITATSADVR